jgi:hypothetical protein
MLLPYVTPHYDQSKEDMQRNIVIKEIVSTACMRVNRFALMEIRGTCKGTL